MGFHSPTKDFIEKRLMLDDIFMPNPANVLRNETPVGLVLVDRSVSIKPGDMVSFQFEDYPQSQKAFPSGIFTEERATIDGQSLEGGCGAR